MTQVAYHERGEALDYINQTDETIPAGTLMPYGSRVAVAGCELPPGVLGSVHVVGVFKDVPKGAEALAAGTEVYLQSDGTVGTAQTESRAGFVVGDAAEDAPTCMVKINT